MPPSLRWNSWTFGCNFLNSQVVSWTEVTISLILTSVWPSVLSPGCHIEATRPHPRIPCSKGEEGYVGLSGLGLRGKGGSAVWTKRGREPQAMWGGRGEIQVKCGDGSLLPYWLIKARQKLPSWLIRARPWGVCWFFFSFLRVLQLGVDEKDPLAVTHPPLLSVTSTSGTQEDWERETLCPWRERGR